MIPFPFIVNYAPLPAFDGQIILLQIQSIPLSSGNGGIAAAELSLQIFQGERRFDENPQRVPK
jgi:hypothetical protein